MTHLHVLSNNMTLAVCFLCAIPTYQIVNVGLVVPFSAVITVRLCLCILIQMITFTLATKDIEVKAITSKARLVPHDEYYSIRA